MLLGELLIREGVIKAPQLEHALSLREQVDARLGTILVELEYIDLDTLARALSAQHRVPAVLTKHVAAIDPEVVALFPAKVASSHHAIPLGYTQGKPPRLVVAFRDPASTPPDDIAFAAGTRIDIGVAPEMLIRRCLAKYYGVRERKYVDVDASFLQKPEPSTPSPPVVKAAPIVLEAPPIPGVEEPPPIDPDPVVRPAPDVIITDEALPPDEGWDEPEAPAPVARPMTAPPDALVPVLGIEEAIEALKAGKSRDEIGNTLAAWLQSAYGIGLVLIVKDGLGMALGWRGHAPGIEASAIEAIAMPLGPPSMLTSAYEGRTSFRGPPPEIGMPIQKKLWSQLRCEPPKEVLVIPVLLGSRVVNILYAHATSAHGLPDAALEDAARVAANASTAFARLIRRTK